MKKILILSAALLTGFFALSCGDSSSEPEDDPNMPAVKIEVGDIADNKATVTAALEKGNFYGAKIVTGVRVSTLTLDYTREIPLSSTSRRTARRPNCPSRHSSPT